MSATATQCEACGRPLGADLYLGTPRRYCDARCRQRAFYHRFKRRFGIRPRAFYSTPRGARG